MSLVSAQIIHSSAPPTYTLFLTSDERRKSILVLLTSRGEVRLQIPRGRMLQHGDILLIDESAETVQILASSEPVLTVKSPDALLLLRSAYHLGNRHVPLEITANWLKLQPDPVLKEMLEKMGLTVTEEDTIFHPEGGAYHSH